MSGNVRKGFLIAGIVVMAAALAFLLVTVIRDLNLYEKAEYYLERLYAAMPERTEGVPEQRSDNKTPIFEVDGLNFAGVLEMPDYELTLPVYGGWDTDKLRAFPCLFSGSAASGDLILGSSSVKGLFPFVKQLAVDDAIVFTDMTGVRYSYRISDIRHMKTVDRDTVTKEKGDLILFIRDQAAFDYVIVKADSAAVK